MDFLRKIFIALYLVMMLGAGAVFLLIPTDIPTQVWSDAITTIHTYENLSIALWVIGGLFIIVGIIGSLRMSKKVKDNNLITFHNPDGEVTVSISAIEDYIKKVAKNIPHTTDIRSRVSFTKKGIKILSDVSIIAGTNIPYITEKIQMEVRNKLQAMLGIDDNIDMVIRIKKIIGDVPAIKEDHEGDEPIRIPFR